VKQQNDEFEACKADLESQIEQARLQLSQTTAHLDSERAKTQTLTQELTNSRHLASEALLISRTRDPQIDVLGEWMTSINAMLKSHLRIKNVEVVDTSLVVTYDFETECIVTYGIENGRVVRIDVCVSNVV
jgi:hypothetical protein